MDITLCRERRGIRFQLCKINGVYVHCVNFIHMPGNTNLVISGEECLLVNLPVLVGFFDWWLYLCVCVCVG